MLYEAYHSIAARAFQGELLESPLRVEPAFRLRAVPRTVRPQHPREHVIGQFGLEDLGEAAAQLGVGDRHHRLDPPVEVALPDVRRAAVVVRLAAGAAAEDARVLEKPSDDRAHPDPL